MPKGAGTPAPTGTGGDLTDPGGESEKDSVIETSRRRRGVEGESVQ